MGLSLETQKQLNEGTPLTEDYNKKKQNLTTDKKTNSDTLKEMTTWLKMY